MIEPLRNWLGMGATIPARIQPGSIDHVPFPTVVPCLVPAVPSRMKIVICRFDFGCRCNRIGRSTLWQDQSPGQTNPKTRREELCYAPPISL
ncbi:hypothetical protein KSP39_PZI012677 [Platanthera zijinensis]|uniref:Uncharacterized protein n=1 Tax=Platanthera zijinensis TaxID=2320716 RepID=A0AAP0BGQ9_9ASPA